MVITDKQNFELLDKIKNLNVFNRFEENQIKELINACTLKKFGKGEIIINEGSVDNWIYILISGSVKILKGDQIFGIFKRVGEVFGEMRVIVDSPRSASIIADAETTCLAVDFAKFKSDFEKAQPVILTILYRMFAEILAVRLRKTTEELAEAKKEIGRLKNGEKN
jgi:CRP/FNR family transcriptional regulator, cyclic AMP receptor protein